MTRKLNSMPKAQLTVRLEDGSDYSVLKRAGGAYQVIGHRAGGSYTVAVAGSRVTCTCPNYIHLQASTPNGRCKHGTALVLAGLLDPTKAPSSPVPEEVQSDSVELG